MASERDVTTAGVGPSPVRVEVEVLERGGPWVARVGFVNVSERAVELYFWALLEEERFTRRSFEVFRDGEQVAYRGMVVKRVARDVDWRRIEPGERRVAERVLEGGLM